MTVVRKSAIGSLLPDSSSRSGLSLPLRLTFRDRITAKTAAASVEDMTAPNSSPSWSENPSTGMANSPTATAVSRTPNVARAMPWPRTGRIIRQLVSRPPENKMKAKASVPTNLATAASSK